APLFHSAMKTVAPIRKELGIKTFFNMLGPLVNPARPRYQLLGVFSLELARLYAYLYQKSNTGYTIVHALEGYDEISLTCDFKTFTPKGEHIHSISDMGFDKIDPLAITGGSTVQESAEIFKAVLDGKGTTEQHNVVLCNAAVAIRTIKPESSFADCFYEAEESLNSGRALRSFNRLLS
ncbi:MAG: anthranilate phosphoribosyltransferase, partial [Bacteroidetes bacterium]|nr:anthranilate phosphoribosyltransferase [Bacteroidota bacterium]